MMLIVIMASANAMSVLFFAFGAAKCVLPSKRVSTAEQVA
jgi:hypothetical protein